MAYILGYVYADGSIFINKHGGWYLDLTSTDLELVRKIRLLLGSNHKIGKYKPKGANCKIRYKLQIGSKELIADLNKLGITKRKGLTIRLPEIPEQFFKHFIRGYFDGDGSVNLGKYWRKDRNTWFWQFSSSFISGSKNFLSDIHHKLHKYIKGGFSYTKNRGYELVFSRRDSIALFNFMYDNVPTSMFLERKYARFKEAFKILNYT